MERINILEYEINDNEEVEEVVDEEIQKFKVTDLNSCNWVFRRLALIKTQEEEITELAKNEIERINKWKENELKKNENSKQFLEGLLVEYFITQKQVDPKFKLSTPFGKVTSRKQQPSYKYDTEKFIEWAEENEHIDLIRIKKEVDKKATKEAFKVNGNQLVDETTGLIVEGVTVSERPDSVTIKVE